MRKIIACLGVVFVSSLASSALAQTRFPVAADQYRETIAGRIESTWDKIEKKLDHHRVSNDRKQEIREAFDEAVARINEVVDKASTDGKISRGEAYRISTMTAGLRGKLRGALALNRGAEAKAEKAEPPRRAPVTSTSAAATKGTSAKDEELDSTDSKRNSEPVGRNDASRAPRTAKTRAGAKAAKVRRPH